MKKMNKKGFTLIEMLVVIAIIAVLVSIIIPTVTSATDKADAAAIAANLRSVKAEIVTAALTDDTTSVWAGIDLDTAGDVTLTEAQTTAAGKIFDDASKFTITIGADKSVTVKYDSKDIDTWAGEAK